MGRVRRTLDILVGMVFLAAAFGKAWSLTLVAATLARAFPFLQAMGSTSYALTAMVILGEAMFGFLLVWGWKPPVVRAAGIVLLAMFSGFLVRVWIDPVIDGCNCFGALTIFESAMGHPAFGLIRNALLMAVLFVPREQATAIPHELPGSPGSPGSPGFPAQHRAFVRGGFTLIELLAVVAVIAFIVAILLPSFERIRRQSDDVESLATIRQLSTALHLYTNDHDSVFPYFAVPGDPDSPYELFGVDLTPWRTDYFYGLSFMWVSLVRPYFAATPDLKPLPFIIGSIESERIIWSRFVLTHAAFASPEYWQRDVDGNDPRHLRSTRRSEIRWPSRKGLIIDVGCHDFQVNANVSGMVLVGLADGSVARKSSIGADWVNRPFGAINGPIFCTRDGLRGIDWE